MRRSLRTLLVALVATLGIALVFPSVAEAKPKSSWHSKTTTKAKSTHKATHKKTARRTTTTTTKRVVKHPWKKNAKTSPAAKHHPHKG